MVDFRQESDLRRSHRVVFRQEQLKTEDATLVKSIYGVPEAPVLEHYLRTEIARVRGSRRRNIAGSPHGELR